MSAATLPAQLLERAAALPAGVALRNHRLGIWAETTWSALADLAGGLGGALLALGAGSGQTVALSAENSPEWIAADLAIQGTGARSLALDPSLAPETVARLLDEFAVQVVVVGDEEQFDKIPSGRRLIVIDARGLGHKHDDEDVSHFADLVATGDRQAWAARVRSLVAGEAALLDVHIDGGSARAVARTHGDALARGAALASAVAATPGDEWYPQHSFAHPTERAVVTAGLLHVGYMVDIGHADGLFQAEMQAVQPTLLHASAAWLDRLSADVDARSAATGGLKKLALRTGLKRRAPVSTPRRPPFPMTKAAALVWAAATLLFFMFTPGGDDVVRLAVAGVAGLAIGAALVLAGHSVQTPLRRRYGLARARAVISHAPASSPGASVLGALGVPLVPQEDRP